MNWYLKVLTQYTDFKGRARRKEYWMFVLFNIIASILLGIIDELLGLTYGNFDENGILSTVYSLAVIVPSLAVGARRMHDIGKSGWYYLIPIYSFILACTDSEHGPNKWGDNPKGEGNTDELEKLGTE